MGTSLKLTLVQKSASAHSPKALCEDSAFGVPYSATPQKKKRLTKKSNDFQNKLQFESKGCKKCFLLPILAIKRGKFTSLYSNLLTICNL